MCSNVIEVQTFVVPALANDTHFRSQIAVKIHSLNRGNVMGYFSIGVLKDIRRITLASIGDHLIQPAVRVIGCS